MTIRLKWLLVSYYVCSHLFAFGFTITSTTTTSAKQQQFTLSAISTPEAAAAAGSAPYLKSVLKKPSKMLTVGVEFDLPVVSSTTPKKILQLSNNEISLLSMQLRRSKVSSIWCTDVDVLREIVLEQKSSMGSFPGPIPVIYHGGSSSNKDLATTAMEYGASAIVRSAASNDEDEKYTNDFLEGCCEIIWNVTSVNDVKLVEEKTSGMADAFLVHLPPLLGSDDSSQVAIGEIISSLPPNALCIASLAPMQQPDSGDGDDEIEQGRALKNVGGVHSILVRSSIVGDAEDLSYAQYLVDGLTSKASSEFKFSGLTGSTNGHFGGMQANGNIKWKRRQQQRQQRENPPQQKQNQQEGTNNDE